MNAAYIIMSVPSAQQGIKHKRSVQSFMVNERPEKKIKASGISLKAFIAGFAVRVKSRADDMKLRRHRVDIMLTAGLRPSINPASRLLERPQLEPSDFGLTEEKIEGLTVKLSQFAAPTSAPVPDPIKQVNVPEAALGIRRLTRNVPQREYNVKKAFQELAKRANRIPKPEAIKATQNVARNVAPISTPAVLPLESDTIAVTVTPDYPIPAKVGPNHFKKLSKNTPKKASKSAPKRPRAPAPVHVEPAFPLSIPLFKNPAALATDDVAHERLEYEAALGLTKLWWPEPTGSALRDTSIDAELGDARNIASILMQLQYDDIEKLSEAFAQDAHTTKVAPVFQGPLPNNEPVTAVSAYPPATKPQIRSRRSTRKKRESLPAVSLQSRPLNLDTTEGFMPSAANDFKFKYDSPSGRTASELDTLLNPPKFGTMNKASFKMRTTHRRLQERPKVGVAERLVKEMEEGHEKRIEEFEEDLETGLVVEQVQRPYDQENVSDWIKFTEAVWRGLE
jgi:hypothetical protein